jgi:hypothetical protein
MAHLHQEMGSYCATGAELERTYWLALLAEVHLAQIMAGAHDVLACTYVRSTTLHTYALVV